MLRYLKCGVLSLLLLTILHAGLVNTTLTAQEAKQPQAKKAEQKQPADKKSAAKEKRPNPALAPIIDKPGLPRVLLIGDSISMGYTLPVRKLLADKANLHRVLTNCGPSSRGVESLEAWLGKDKWDVIHFNFGLHDIVYYSADGKTRVDPTEAGARHQVPIADYEKNLRQIVSRLKETGAVLIWCSTTPVPEGSAGRIADESTEYNQVAAKIMSENNIAINDLHSFAKPKLADIQLPKNVHFTPQGSTVLAEQVTKTIEAALVAKQSK
jgi:acyl-CoA thioesterase-1